MRGNWGSHTEERGHLSVVHSPGTRHWSPHRHLPAGAQKNASTHPPLAHTGARGNAEIGKPNVDVFQTRIAASVDKKEIMGKALNVLIAVRSLQWYVESVCYIGLWDLSVGLVLDSFESYGIPTKKYICLEILNSP